MVATQESGRSRREGGAISVKFHPVVAQINQLIALEGGELLRGRPVGEGRMQYWVKRGNGETLSAPTVIAIADRLGVGRKENKVASPDLISAQKAAAISGYSTTAIFNARKQGTLAGVKQGVREWVFDRAEVMRWAQQKKDRGSRYQPRIRRKGGALSPTRNGVRDRGGEIPVQQSSLRDRLNRYLDKIEGTPFEMTQGEFVAKVVEQALKKLGA